MRCPFLQETVVRQCRSAGLRMMIRTPLGAGVFERCATEQYRTCPHLHSNGVEEDTGHCPQLDESPVQFCSAAPVMKLIPHSEPLVSRCGGTRHRYCDAYLALSASAGEPGDGWVDGIRVPAKLAFAQNHLWFDEDEGETWQAGIDGLLARVLGRVERVTFLTGTGTVRPAVVVTAHGADLQLVFPHSVPVTGVHTYLRERPELITEDPYGRGWLFEGERASASGLLRGAEAQSWMAAECERLARFAHDLAAAHSPGLAGDGGAAIDGLIEHLTRDEILALFHEFFPAWLKGDESA